MQVARKMNYGSEVILSETKTSRISRGRTITALVIVAAVFFAFFVRRNSDSNAVHAVGSGAAIGAMLGARIGISETKK